MGDAFSVPFILSWLEAPTESPELTVKLKLFLIRASGSVKFNSVFDQLNSPMGWKNSVLAFKSQLLGNSILASTFNFCIDFIDFIFLCCYHHLCNYCNRVFIDQSSNAVCRCLYRSCCYFNVYKTNQLTGNVYNDSEVTIKGKEDIRSCYAKYVFLVEKITT